MPGRFNGADITVDVIEVKGQRKTYRFPNRFPTGFGEVVHLVVQPGDMVAFCPDDDDGNTYNVALGPLDRVRDAVPISAPPRIVELAKYQPLHLRTTAFIAASRYGKITFPTDRRLLIWALVGAADGNRFKMENFWLEVPPGVQGIEAGKRLWLVVEDPVLEDQPDHQKRLVLRAVAAIDEMFP